MKMICLMAALGATVAAEAKWARPDLVEKVARGELAEAEVSWWGYDGADATPYIQAALSSKASKVTLDRREGPWFARPLFGRSNLTFIVPEGVTLCAKRGEFHRQADALLRFNTATNVTLTGGGTIQMWFEDYTNKTLYGWSEWRHAIALLSCHNVCVENLRIADSGGDGIYLGQQGRVPACTDVTIRNVKLSRHNRQGISVISADRLLIENCVMEDTCGTLPMAGIDFEPNNFHQMLRDITVRNCVARGNHGAGFDFSVGNLNVSSPAISITLENCRSEGNHKPTKFHRATDILTRFHGAVTFRNCIFNDLDGGRGTFRSPEGQETMSVTFVNCHAADPDKGGKISPLGPEYGWGRIPTLSWPDGSTMRLETARIPDLARVKIHDAAPGKPVRIKPVHIRTRAEYLVYVDSARRVRLKASLRAVGRSEPKPSKILVSRATGGGTKRINLDQVFKKEQEIAFNAPAAGFYRLDAHVGGNHVLYFTETDAPIALVNSEDLGQPGWNGRPGEVYLWVPDGCRCFAVSASGGGSNERVHAKLFDPNGTCVWDVDNIGSNKLWFSPPQPITGLWKLAALKATKGCMDDYSFGVFGIPCLMFLSPEKTWQEK